MSERKFEYPEFVKKEKIEANFDSGYYEEKRRYNLIIPFSENTQNNILIILKNPSKADKKKSDRTVNNVITYIKNKLVDIDQVIITNLFVYCSESPKKLNKKIYEKGFDYVVGTDKLPELYNQNNNDFIKEGIKKSSKIIVAWGNANGIKGELYQKRIKQIKDLLKSKEMWCIKKTKHGNPWHGLTWKDKNNYYDILKYKWDDDSVNIILI